MAAPALFPLDPAGLPLPLATLVFLAAAGIVWIAGVRLTRAAAAVAMRTGIEEALVGLVLLGVATSLPEIATTLVASRTGNAELAVANLFGGIAGQVAVLALADATYRAGALTASPVPPGLILQGVLLVAVLAVAILAIVAPDPGLGAMGAWTPLLVVLYLVSLAIIRKSRAPQAWRALDGEAAEPARPGGREATLARALLIVLVSSAVILAAGFLLARSAEAIAVESGLGSSFVGVLALAMATSLPEISTTLTAVRLGHVAMAVSNIFGTNLFEAALLAVADLAYPGGPILAEAGVFAVVAALLGILLTCIYLVGLVERRDRTFLGLGPDSLAAVLVYLGGLALLFVLR